MRVIALIALLALSCTVYAQDSTFHLIPEGQRVYVLWSAVGYVVKEIDRVNEKLDAISTSLAESREALAEMRGRQAVATGTAAGIPTGLAGLLFWWLRRDKKRNGNEEK